MDERAGWWEIRGDFGSGSLRWVGGVVVCCLGV